ncbi:hypothetical protein G9A89_004744 [Geosiphon pyriformis]|nr:hypothetical protein G9A89_004744 [Geosiphon pyriformis]
MALINRATQKNVCQMKKVEYIEYTMKLPIIQLKYFDNNGQGIKSKKVYEINAGYDLRYLGKDILVLQPKFLTKINLKIALKIPPGAMVQIAS